MRLSNYNIYNRKDGYTQIYNTFWKKEIFIPNSIFHKIYENNIIGEKLEKLGFLTISEGEEIKIAKNMYSSITCQSSRLELTVMITMSCNFRCSYCFEDHKNRENTIINIDDLIIWLNRIINEYSFSELAICFHGGEPLLFANEVKKIITEVKNNFPKLNLDFSCVTNGYFLTQELAVELSALGIKTVQVTLNGTKDVHDRIRILKNGKGTFDKIFDNIKKTKCDFFIINILYNDKNVESILSLISYLKENNLDSKIKFLTINQIEETIIDDIDLYNKKMAEIKIRIMEYAVKSGFKIPFLLDFSACTLQQKNSFIVSPDGNIYKCISLVGEKKLLIGNLKDKIEVLYKNQSRFMMEKNSCYKCKYYPLCNTRCLFQEKLGNKFCQKTYFDEFIPRYLDLYSQYKDSFYRE